MAASEISNSQMKLESYYGQESEIRKSNLGQSNNIDSKPVTITVIEANGDIREVSSPSQINRQQNDNHNSYLMIPSPATTEDIHVHTNDPKFNVGDIHDVKVGFIDESYNNGEMKLSSKVQDEVYYAIEAVGEVSTDTFKKENSCEIKTIECFEKDSQLIYKSRTTDYIDPVYSKKNIDINGLHSEDKLLKTLIDGAVCYSNFKCSYYFCEKSFCLICNKHLCSDSNALLIASTVTSCSGKPAAVLLSQRVGDPFTVMVDDEMLCRSCFQLLELVDTLEERLQKISTRLVSNYWQTAQKRKRMQCHKNAQAKPRNHKLQNDTEQKKFKKTICVYNECKTVKNSISNRQRRKKRKTLNNLRANESSHSELSSYDLEKPGYSGEACSSKDPNDFDKHTLQNDPRCPLIDGDDVPPSSPIDEDQSLSWSNTECTTAPNDPVAESSNSTILLLSTSAEEDGVVVRKNGKKSIKTARFKHGKSNPNKSPAKGSKGRPRKLSPNVWCNFCNKYIRNQYYNVHLNMHTRNVSFPCQDCHLVFYSKSSLQSHFRRNHAGEGEKKFICEQCGRRFIYQRDMLIHFNTVHKNVRNYTCEVCNESFKMIGHLNYHMRIHTGEKPNTCYVCKQSFKRTGILKTHIIDVHGLQYFGKYRERIKKCEKVEPEENIDDVFIIENFPNTVADVVTVSTEHSNQVFNTSETNRKKVKQFTTDTNCSERMGNYRFDWTNTVDTGQNCTDKETLVNINAAECNIVADNMVLLGSDGSVFMNACAIDQ